MSGMPESTFQWIYRSGQEIEPGVGVEQGSPHRIRHLGDMLPDGAGAGDLQTIGDARLGGNQPVDHMPHQSSKLHSSTLERRSRQDVAIARRLSDHWHNLSERKAVRVSYCD